MEFTAHVTGLRYVIPEIVVLAAAIVSLFVHVFTGKRGPRLAGAAALLGLAAGAAVVAAAPTSPGSIFAGGLVVDHFALFLKAVVLLAGALSILVSFSFFDVERHEPGEIYSLFLLSIVGMMAAISSVDLISTYVAFELFAIASYILAGISKQDRRSPEAGVKYFFLGTLSSGIMLLGMALVFGLTGETEYAAIGRLLPAANGHIALMGMILFFSGLFFKASLVPFHMWAPDVYEGAPTPVAIFLSTAPKAAVFAILIRLITAVFTGFETEWTSIFQVIALATMFWGNIAALLQRNVKRLLAYSAIAHAGYLSIGLAAWGEEARTAILFYLVFYALMNAAAFGMLLFSPRSRGFGEEIDDLRGLARRSPLAGASIVVILLSLTGIPPTAGFVGKYLLFMAAVDKRLYVLAVAGALNSVISLFYYFRIGRAVFLDEPASADRVRAAGGACLILWLAAAAVLIFGVLPSFVLNLAAAAALGH
jgi:NADH-quinone oxidoreductase subunit N